jgi:hypothetical protein
MKLYMRTVPGRLGFRLEGSIDPIFSDGTTRNFLALADWIEHVLATHGEPYLKTPDEDLPSLVRLSYDVYLTVAAALAAAAYLLAKAARWLFARLLAGSSRKQKTA